MLIHYIIKVVLDFVFGLFKCQCQCRLLDDPKAESGDRKKTPLLKMRRLTLTDNDDER